MPRRLLRSSFHILSKRKIRKFFISTKIYTLAIADGGVRLPSANTAAAHPIDGVVGEFACGGAVAAGFGYCKADDAL